MEIARKRTRSQQQGDHHGALQRILGYTSFASTRRSGSLQSMSISTSDQDFGQGKTTDNITLSTLPFRDTETYNICSTKKPYLARGFAIQ